jgi:ATP-dependent Zn protease
MLKPQQKARKGMSREATAYHEAGHAVAAWCLGYRPATASILAGDDSAGQVRHESPFPGINFEFDGSDWTRLKIERAIMICLAGPIAQRRHRRTSWRRWHGAADYATATELALRTYGSGEIASAFLKWLDLRAKLLVEDHWSAIERVAIALLKHATLTNEDITSLVVEPHLSQAIDQANLPLIEHKSDVC